MNVHFVVYSALIKIMNSIRDVFPTVLLMIFCAGFLLFLNYEWVLPQICRRLFKQFDINPPRKVIPVSKRAPYFLLMLRYMEPAAISFSGRENFIAKF